MVSKLSKPSIKVVKLVLAGLLVIVALVVAVALLLQRSCFHYLYGNNPYLEDALDPNSNQIRGTRSTTMQGGEGEYPSDVKLSSATRVID